MQKTKPQQVDYFTKLLEEVIYEKDWQDYTDWIELHEEMRAKDAKNASSAQEEEGKKVVELEEEEKKQMELDKQKAEIDEALEVKL